MNNHSIEMNTNCIYSYKVFKVTMHDCANMFSLIGYHYIYYDNMEAVMYVQLK